MTECNQSSFAFEAHFSPRVEARFDGSQMTTDGGGLLLRAVDKKIGLLKRVVSCFTDARDPERVEHPLSEMLAQRTSYVYDANDQRIAMLPSGASPLFYVEDFLGSSRVITQSNARQKRLRIWQGDDLREGVCKRRAGGVHSILLVWLET